MPAPRTFAPTPPGFDVHTAPQDELRQHGLPRRPDPVAEPRLHDLWCRAFMHPIEFVRAHLDVDPVMSNRDRGTSTADEFGTQKWGGLALCRAGDNEEFNEPAVMVYAELHVPHVSDANPTDDAMIVGFWVGIDGVFTAGDHVLQAGIAAKVHDTPWGTSSVSYWAWTEWWSAAHRDPSHRVNNFEVRPGDEICVLVCATRPDYGHVTLMNRRTTTATTIGVPAPQGVQLTGSSVEWVVEGVSKGLPCFGTALAADCVAATEHRVFDLRPNGIPFEITGPSARDRDAVKSLTRTYVASDNLLAIEWLDYM